MSGEFGDINCRGDFVHDAHFKVSEELQGYGNDRPRYRTTQLVGAFMNKALYSLIRRVAYDEAADSEPQLRDYNYLLDRVEGELAALRNGIEKALSGDNRAILYEEAGSVPFTQSAIGQKCDCNEPFEVIAEHGERRYRLPAGYYGNYYHRAHYYAVLWHSLCCVRCGAEREDFFVMRWSPTGDRLVIVPAFAKDYHRDIYRDVYAAIKAQMPE